MLVEVERRGEVGGTARVELRLRAFGCDARLLLSKLGGTDYRSHGGVGVMLI